MSRALSLILGFGIGGLFLWLTMRHVNGAGLIAAARGVDGMALLLAPVCLAIGYACRVHRWRAMLLPHNPTLGQGRAAVAFVGSIAVNNLAPFRLGDALRCFGFARWLGVAPGAVVATVMIERVLDLIALLLALALVLWAFSLTGDAFGVGSVGALVLAGLATGALVLMVEPRLLAFSAGFAFRAAGWIGPKAGARLEGFLTPLVAGLAGLSERRAMAGLIGWTVPVWVFEGATYWAVAKAMPGLSAPGAAWLAMPVGTLATLLPSTPGHVGTFDYFAQMAAVAAGNPLAEATAFVVIVHLVLWLSTTVTGGVCLLIWVLAPGARSQA